MNKAVLSSIPEMIPTPMDGNADKVLPHKSQVDPA